MIFTTLVNVSFETYAENTSAPYYTYTADSNGNLIKTTEAYTPGKQIYSINGKRFEKLEHIFVDNDDYIYITDSKGITTIEQVDPVTGEVIINPLTGNPALKTYVGKIIILDRSYQFVAEIFHDSFRYPKSTFVTDEGIYVVDVTSSNIFIFDKNELISNQTIELKKIITKPTHPIFQHNLSYQLRY